MRRHYARLATGYGIGIATVHRYIREAIEVLAALAPTPAEAMRTIRTKAFVILDGTLLPIDRIATDTPYHSGKHKRHGMNVQVLTDPVGRLLWASPALPGSTHDLTAARQHGIIDALAAAGLKSWADKAYQGAGRPVRVPFRGRHLKQWKRRHNTTHAKICCLGEQAMATLKGWRNVMGQVCRRGISLGRLEVPDPRPPLRRDTRRDERAITELALPLGEHLSRLQP
ncbi:hypothetical protein ABID94_007450 [Streptomyces sp. PvR018]